MRKRTPLPQGKVTIMFTDIEDSSRMTVDVGNDTYKQQMRDPYAYRFMTFLARHHGVWVQIQGDGFMAVFQRAADALACVYTIQEDLIESPINCVGSTSWTLRVRIGVHTSDQEIFPTLIPGKSTDMPLSSGNVEYPGSDTNFAARIGGLGIGGQTIVSESAYRAAATSGMYTWQDWPNRRLKSFESAPETVWEMLIRGQSRGEPGLRWVPDWYRGELNRYIARPSLQEQVINHFKTVRDNVRKRLVTLYAEGGMGKTRLALACAVQMVGLFTDGVHFVDLTRLSRSPESVAEAIARQLELAGPAAQPDGLIGFLRRKEMLILLDNYEAVDSEEVASFLCELVVQTDSVRLLVTGREAVRADDIEQLVEMNDGMTHQEAEDLFIAYARLKKNDTEWIPSPAERPYLNDIIRLTVGIPLATELVAAWVSKRSLLEIASSLQATPLGEITQKSGRGVRADRSPHHASLMQSLDWSYSLLAPEVQSGLAKLSLFAVDFDVEAVAKTKGLNNTDAQTLLQRLQEASLLRRVEIANISRYRFHRFTHAYAQKQFVEQFSAEVRNAMEQDQAHYFLRIAEEAEPFLKKQDPDKKINRLESEVQNLSAALDWCLENDVLLGLRVSTALWRFWWMRGYARMGMEKILALMDKADKTIPVWAEAASVAGHLARHIGDFTKAETLYDASLEAFQQINDVSGTARVLRHIGVLAWHQDREDAQSFLEAALLKSQESNKPEDIAESYYELGNFARHKGMFGEAEQYIKNSLVFFKEAKDPRWTGTALLALGNVTVRLQQWDEARTYYRQSLDLFAELRDKGRLTLLFERIAAFSYMQGGSHSAAVLIGASKKLRNEIGSPLPGPDAKEYYNSLIDGLKHMLGQAFVEAQDEGSSASLDQAIEIARKEVDRSTE